MFSTEVKELYKMRAKALAKTKVRLSGKGSSVTTITAAEKKSTVADFRMDGDLVKFKAAKNHNINILFEAQNGANYGWIVTTKAKWFIMYYEADNLAYLVDVEKVREYINNPLHTIPTTEKGGRSKGWSYMISIDLLKDRDIIVDVLHI